MHFRSILLLIVVALTAAFAALNWTAFTTPTALWVGFTTVQAPIGVIMLSLTAFLCVLFVAWVIYLQGTVIIESRRQARELNAQRDLADKAEASRFTELRSFMSAELLRVTQAADESRLAMLARMAEVEQRQRVLLEQTSNTLSAYIGELEDRLAQAPYTNGVATAGVPRVDRRVP